MKTRVVCHHFAFVLCFVSGIPGWAQECHPIQVPNVKSIFAAASSPVGNQVLFYGSEQEAEGEFVTGNLLRLNFTGSKTDVVQIRSGTSTNPPAPIWGSKASAAYIRAENGVARLEVSTNRVELLIAGHVEGLALSSDDSLLAYWRIENASDTLVIYDIPNRVVRRTWSLKDRYEGDKSGWDMAFTSNSKMLYARTYDERSKTPLKRFDLETGVSATISQDALSVAAAADGSVYFVAEQGMERKLLKVITARPLPTVVSREFSFDKLSMTANGRWLVAQDYRTKNIVTIDTRSDAVASVGKHDGATVMADGRLVFFAGGDILVGAACAAPPKANAH